MKNKISFVTSHNNIIPQKHAKNSLKNIFIIFLKEIPLIVTFSNRCNIPFKQIKLCNLLQFKQSQYPLRKL